MATGQIISGGDNNDSLTGTSGSDTLYGYYGNDTIWGGDDFDFIEGGMGNDLIFGGAGNDLITGDSGDDTINGGDGIDRARYSGARSAYNVTRSGDTIIVTGPDGTDTLSSVERLEFSGANLYLDSTDTYAQVFRLYKASLDRVPDVPGADYQSLRLEGGVSLENAAAGFVNSPEFIEKYGNLSSSGYVEQLYRNVMGRSAQSFEINYHVERLNHGVSRQAVLIGFSESPEFITKVVNTLGDSTLNGLWISR